MAGRPFLTLPRQLVECVPNFSVGRDAAVAAALSAAIGEAGATVLRTDSDGDHNRSVITFAGSPETVSEAAFRAISLASELIDLRRHGGVHPRIGATDVVPFVPLSGITLHDCGQLARTTGERVWRELHIPVYFYEASALEPSRRRLEVVRRGQFEAPALLPDLGGPALHPTAGASILGARRLLAAFNINLDSADIVTARAIAHKIRASNGGFPGVKAMGVFLASRHLAQVSMNLTNLDATNPEQVFRAVEAEAARHGIDIHSTELIGLIPRASVESSPGAFAVCEDFGTHRILEARLAEALPYYPRL